MVGGEFLRGEFLAELREVVHRYFQFIRLRRAGVEGEEGGRTCFDSPGRFRYFVIMNSEIIFEVTEAEEGGYCASALGFGIHTQGETLEELRAMVRDAVTCYFDSPEQAPKIIRLHFVRDEVLAR